METKFLFVANNELSDTLYLYIFNLTLSSQMMKVHQHHTDNVPCSILTVLQCIDRTVPVYFMGLLFHS